MRLIRPPGLKALDPQLLWAHDKLVDSRFDLNTTTTRQGVWLVHDHGASVGIDELRPLHPGDWVFLPRGRRRQAFRPGTRIWSIGYRAGDDATGGWFDDLIILRDRPLMATATERLFAILDAADPDLIARQRLITSQRLPLDVCLRIDAAFREWLATVALTLDGAGARTSGSAPMDGRIATCLDLIIDDPWSPQTTPEALARRVQVSRRRLEQLFRQACGCGLAEHRRLIQIRLAGDLLDRADIPIKQVAFRLGFASTAAFSTWYRRNAGMAPQAWRRRRET